MSLSKTLSHYQPLFGMVRVQTMTTNKTYVSLFLVALLIACYAYFRPTDPQHKKTSPNMAPPSPQTNPAQKKARFNRTEKNGKANPKTQQTAHNKKIIARPFLAPTGPNTEAILEEAGEMLKRGETNEATQLLEQALSEDPNNEEVLFRLGFIKVNLLQQPEEGQTLLKRALEINPASRHAMNSLISSYIRTKDHESAQRFLKQFYKKESGQGQAPLAMGDYLARTGKPKAAINYLLQATQQEETRGYAYEHLATIYTEQKNFQKAAESYDLLIEERSQKLPKSLKNSKLISFARADIDRIRVDKALVLIQLQKCTQVKRILEAIDSANDLNKNEVRELRKKFEEGCQNKSSR